MRGRALVIGAWTPSAGGQSPADVDAERMSELLVSREFEVQLLTGSDATRGRILASYIELIESIVEEEAVVIYFSGHGGILPSEVGADPALHEPSMPGTFQFIAPHDHHQSTDDDFRGISSWELSLLLEGLTRKTRNVTVILDCCYSGQMSRDFDGHEPRATALTWTTIQRHIQSVRDRSDLLGHLARTAELSPLGNANAVRLVASNEWSQSFSMFDEHGRATGILTNALIATLNEIGQTAVSWRALGAAIRARILKQTLRQRPSVEGPVNRMLFSLDEDSAVSTPIETAGGGRLRLEAGRIGSVSVGDVYGVARFDAAGFAPATGIARVRIEHVEAFHAIARPLEWLNGHASLPKLAVAWPLERQLARQPVRVEAPEADRPRLEEAITQTPRLRVAEVGERPIALLRLRNGEIEVIKDDETQLGALHGSWSLEGAITQLQNLAAAQALRELQGEGLTDNEIEVEWGTVHREAHGEVRIARWDDAAISEGDRIYIKVRNRSKAVRYVHVFNIGLRGTITRLSHVSPNGIVLGSGEASHVGPLAEPMTTFEMKWPGGVPRDKPAADRLVVIATTGPVDLVELETVDADVRDFGPGGTGLQQLASQLHSGGARSTGEIKPEPFLVVHRWWMLRPLPELAALAVG
jgi:hypothetical protein